MEKGAAYAAPFFYVLLFNFGLQEGFAEDNAAQSRDTITKLQQKRGTPNGVPRFLQLFYILFVICVFLAQFIKAKETKADSHKSDQQNHDPFGNSGHALGL